MGTKRKVTQVKCKVGNVINGKDKLLVAKLDSLWKYFGHRKAIVASTNVAMGDIYFLKTNQHMMNEKLYVRRSRDYVLRQVAKWIVVEQKKN